MRKLRYIFVGFLIISLLLCSSGCSLPHKENSSSTNTSEPINPNWQPNYIDDVVGTALNGTELVERIAPTVVSVFTEKVTRDIFLRPSAQQGAGSGVIIDPRGYIVTNCHVVEGANTVMVILNDGRSFLAENWVTDPWTDLAVVQIEAIGLPIAHFLNSSLGKLEELEDVVAVGNAFALPGGPTWTKGVVSHLGRPIQESNGVVLYDTIQTDAAINPGNSGGPLVNMAGQVVGINTAIIAEGEGIGFAISTDTAISVLEDLVKNGYVPCAWLGVKMLTVTSAIKSEYDLLVDYGALIIEVVSDSPAAEAGLKENDVVIGFDDQLISSAEQLGVVIRSHNAGDTVEITYMRGEAARTTQATLIQRPPP